MFLRLLGMALDETPAVSHGLDRTLRNLDGD